MTAIKNVENEIKQNETILNYLIGLKKKFIIKYCTALENRNCFEPTEEEMEEIVKRYFKILERIKVLKKTIENLKQELNEIKTYGPFAVRKNSPLYRLGIYTTTEKLKNLTIEINKNDFIYFHPSVVFPENATTENLKKFKIADLQLGTDVNFLGNLILTDDEWDLICMRLCCE